MSVYFMQATATRLIKIGYSANVRRRARRLRCANADTLTTLAVLPRAGRTDERRLHRRFARLCDHGEWFRPGSDLLDFIARLPIAGTPERRTGDGPLLFS